MKKTNIDLGYVFTWVITYVVRYNWDRQVHSSNWNRLLDIIFYTGPMNWKSPDLTKTDVITSNLQTRCKAWSQMISMISVKWRSWCIVRNDQLQTFEQNVTVYAFIGRAVLQLKYHRLSWSLQPYKQRQGSNMNFCAL